MWYTLYCSHTLEIVDKLAIVNGGYKPKRYRCVRTVSYFLGKINIEAFIQGNTRCCPTDIRA